MGGKLAIGTEIFLKRVTNTFTITVTKRLVQSGSLIVILTEQDIYFTTIDVCLSVYPLQKYFVCG